jgi:hypothetical protein
LFPPLHGRVLQWTSPKCHNFSKMQTQIFERKFRAERRNDLLDSTSSLNL